MRTKTLLLSGVVAALSSACVMAQVYSLNAVGYINVTIPPGFSIIANQLNTTNNNISPLLDSFVPSDGTSGLNACVFYKWSNPGTGAAGAWLSLTPDYYGNYNNSPGTPGNFPWDQLQATNTTLNPGEAIFVKNGNSTNIVVTFVGTVLQGSLTNPAITGPGFNLVSSMVPQAGRVDVDLSFPEVDNDVVYIFNPSTSSSPGWQSFIGDEYANGAPAVPWDSPTNPAVNVGQGFFYKANQSGLTIGNAAFGGVTYTTGGYPALWTRTFNVN